MIKCNVIPKETLENYEIKTEKVPGECCNKTKMVACKGIDGSVHKPGETWTVGSDYCKNYKCVEFGQGLDIGVTITECNTTCAEGYKYVEASPSEQTCCGKCEQSACIINGTIRNVNEEWSSADNCHKYKCQNSSGAVSLYLIQFWMMRNCL